MWQTSRTGGEWVFWFGLEQIIFLRMICFWKGGGQAEGQNIRLYSRMGCKVWAISLIS
jgi:hypothetical protein